MQWFFAILAFLLIPLCAFAQDDKCLREATAYDTIYCLDQVDARSVLAHVYRELAKTELIVNGKVIAEGPDYEEVLHKLRLQSLIFSKADNEKNIKIIQRLKMDYPRFIPMYQDAVDWAETEKKKNAAALFSMAQEMQNININDFLKIYYKEAYLSLAAKKGHGEAKNYLDSLD